MIEDLGLLAARVALGLGLASHGAQKAFGWFGGPGPEGAAKYMDSLGMRPGEAFGRAASTNEMASGVLVALGLGGPLAPGALISNMLVAAMLVHAKNGFFAANRGVEVNVLYSAGALALASSGYGKLSLDHVLGVDEKLHHPVVKTLAIAGALAVGWAILGQRDVSPPEGTLATPTIKGGGMRNGESSPQPAAQS